MLDAWVWLYFHLPIGQKKGSKPGAYEMGLQPTRLDGRSRAVQTENYSTTSPLPVYHHTDIQTYSISDRSSQARVLNSVLKPQRRQSKMVVIAIRNDQRISSYKRKNKGTRNTHNPSPEMTSTTTINQVRMYIRITWKEPHDRVPKAKKKMWTRTGRRPQGARAPHKSC